MTIRFSCALALTVLGVVLSPALTLTAHAQARLSEPSGGFSYVPPAGWKVKTFPGLKYKICYAAPSAGFAPNITTLDETAPVGLDEYVRVSFANMKRAYTKLAIKSQGAFVTNSGLRGSRTVTNGTMQGRNVRQVFYIFPAANNRKILATVSWLQASGEKYTAATDAAMKTFTLK